MSIVIRSNVKATRSIGNVHNYHGPMDFDTILNFERGMYSVGGDPVSLADAIMFSRPSVAEYRAVDGIWRTARENEPRLHWLTTGRSGLLMESLHENLYAGSVEPSRTIPVSLHGADYNYLALRIWGGGSATISTPEPAIDETESRTATEGSPAMLVFSAGSRVINVTVTVSGSVSRIMLDNAPAREWATVLKSPVPMGHATRAADRVSMSDLVFEKISQGQGTLVFAYSREPEILPGGNASCDWFSLPSSGATVSGVHVRSLTRDTLVPRTFGIDGSNFDLANMPMSGANSRTIALAWSGGGTTIRTANNGVVAEQSSPTLPPFQGLVMSGHAFGTAFRGDVNAVLTHFAHYDRALSQSELQAATTSWL